MCGSLSEIFEPSQNTSTSSTTTGPGKQYQSAYSNILKQAQGVAGAAYDPATEKNVAGFAQPTYDAFSGVYGNQGVYQPYASNAFNYAQNAAAPSTANIDTYMNPYVQNVVNATQSQFDTQNTRQLNDVRAQAAKLGALGGSGQLVSEALTREAQGNAQNPVIAGLYNQGYSQALNAAQTDAARQLSAAGVMGSLGGQAQQYGYNDVNALLGIGGLQQQQQQSVYDAATGNAQQRAAYPYQNLQWLSGIASGLGGASGGTTSGTQTTPGPSVGQQLIGAGLAGLSFFNAGGRVGYDNGGVVAPYGGVSYIPQAEMSATRGPTPSLAQASGTAPNSNGMGDLLSSYQQARDAMAGLQKVGRKISGQDSGIGTLGAGRNANNTSGAYATGLPWAPDQGMNSWADGTSVSRPSPRPTRGVTSGVGRFAAPMLASASIPNEMSFSRMAGVYPGLEAFAHGGGVGRLGYADGGDVLDMEDDGTGTYAVPETFPEDAFGSAMPSFGSGVAAMAPTAPMAAQPAPGAGVAPVMTPEAAEKGGGLFGWSPEAKQALLHAGLGIMASKSPNVGVALGEGGLMGAQSYEAAKQKAAQEKLQREKMAQAQSALDQRQKMAMESLALRREQHTSEQRYKDAQIAKMEADLARGTIQQVGNRLVRVAPDGSSVTELYTGGADAAKAPDVVEIYDNQGRKQKAMWDPNAGTWVPVGGSATASGDTTLSREQAKADVKRVNEYKDASDAAGELLSNLDSLSAARAETDREGPWLGMLPNMSNEAQRVAAESENVRLSFVGKTKGAVSDSEMRIFGQATPGMSMSDKAATPIIEGMQLAGKRTQERAIFFDTWLRSRGNLDGAPQAWKKFTDQKPIIQKSQSGKFMLRPENVDAWRSYIPEGDGASVETPPSASGAPDVGTIIDGYRFLGGDPADQTNWEAE